MQWFRHCHLREWAILLTSVQEGLDFVGSSIFLFAVHELLLDRYWQLSEEEGLDVVARLFHGMLVWQKRFSALKSLKIYLRWDRFYNVLLP